MDGWMDGWMDGSWFGAMLSQINNDNEPIS